MRFFKKNFQLNKDYNLEIRAQYPWNDIIAAYQEGTISFVIFHGSKSRVIYKKSPEGLTYVEVLCSQLEAALTGAREIDAKFLPNIGLAASDHWKQLIEDLAKKVSTAYRGKWEGYKYIVCSNGRIPGANSTWLYTYRGKLILEVAPDYPWLAEGAVRDKWYGSYEQFRLDYKPIFVVLMEQGVAERLLKELKHILATAYANARTWEIKVNADKEDCSQ